MRTDLPFRRTRLPSFRLSCVVIIEHLRGDIVESRHRVSIAVADADGRLVAHAGDPHLVTFMRSAAKPFQAVPLVADGVVSRYAITSEELALACASHNSERRQVEVVRQLLSRVGCAEADLACGPHQSLMGELAFGDHRAVGVEIAPPSPVASNCSGKHVGMLALARHHDWTIAGYQMSGHPVQQRVKAALAHYTGLPADAIGEGVDGCGVVSFALPLSAMARGAARLVDPADEVACAVVDAMLTHPDLVAGYGRFCTQLMQTYAHRVLAKVGAEGVYVAALRDRGVGIGLKVEDGNGRAAVVALAGVLEQLDVAPPPSTALPAFACLALTNTRREQVGVMRASGTLSFV